MANYTKSFNFRNGVQVDDSNFIVNPVGLVGIGTSIPEKHLDVRGDAKIIGDARITGFTSVTNIEVVGVMTVGAGITLDSVTGIITANKFVGDASGLTNIVAIATDGFIANVGSLSTTARVGIGSLAPTSLLDVLGDSKFVGVSTFTGHIDVSNSADFGSHVNISGVTTANDDVNIEMQNTFAFFDKSTDSVELGLNSGQSGRGVVLGFGTESQPHDLEMFFSGFDSYIRNTGTHLPTSELRLISGNDGGIRVGKGVSDATSSTQNSPQSSTVNSTSALFNTGAELYFSNSKKFETSPSGANVLGVLSATGYQGASGGSAEFPQGISVPSGTFTTNLTTGVGATVGFGSTAFFKDNAKVVFGSGEDFEIFHSGSDSVIRDARSSGSVLKIGADSLILQNKDGNEPYLQATDNGSVKIYYDFGLKLETISVGASVYNELKVASFLGGTSGLSPHYGSLRYGDESAGSPYSTRSSLDLINTDSGNINYYINANNLSNTGDFHWHKGFNNNRLMTLTGIGGSLGIGITIPNHDLHVVGTSTVTGNSFFGNDVEIKRDLSVQRNLDVVGDITGALTGSLTGNVSATSGTSNFKQILVSSGIATISDLRANKLGVNISPVASDNLVTVQTPNAQILVDDLGRVGIRTTSSGISTDVVIQADRTSATFGVVGVGTTRPEAAVDFGGAGKDAGTFLQQRRYMYPPLLNNAEEAALTDMQKGALIFNTDTNKLKFYNGSSWTNVNET